MLQFKKITYVPRLEKYLPENQVQKGEVTDSISGTQFRAMMASGEPIPAWFSDPDVIKILREVSPPKNRRGFAILFTGLSGGGKTTISHALIKRLQSVIPTRKMTILDGDVVRTHLSKELKFSVAHRNINVARMGFVAAEVAKHGGIAICSSIAPFEKSREATKRLVEPTGGGYLLVHVSTSAEECAARDVKGLYRKAMQGTIELTGVSHPYENPENAQLTIDAGKVSVEDSVRFIVGWLVQQGYIDKDLVSESEQGKDLESQGVLTEGKEDPIKDLCKFREELPSHQPRIIVALGANGVDQRAIVEEVLAAAGQSAARVQLRASDVVRAEQGRGAS